MTNDDNSRDEEQLSVGGDLSQLMAMLMGIPKDTTDSKWRVIEFDMENDYTYDPRERPNIKFDVAYDPEQPLGEYIEAIQSAAAAAGFDPGKEVVKIIPKGAADNEMILAVMHGPGEFDFDFAFEPSPLSRMIFDEKFMKHAERLIDNGEHVVVKVQLIAGVDGTPPEESGRVAIITEDGNTVEEGTFCDDHFKEFFADGAMHFYMHGVMTHDPVFGKTKVALDTEKGTVEGLTW